MKEYLMKIDDKTWLELEEIKKNTGAPFAYIIRRAIEEYIKKLNEAKWWKDQNWLARVVNLYLE